MTLIKQAKKSLHTLFIGIAGVFMLGGIFAVYEYTALAETRHSIRSMEVEVESYGETLAELQNELYRKTDPTLLEEEAHLYSMILEENPLYLSSERVKVAEVR
jgi:hypothetical protein